jgi:branched-subunit amino acid transport protein AzlD
MLMATTATTLAESLFCDECGQELEPKHRVCEGCGAVPTRQWFQLMSLATLLAAVASNSAVGLFVLPRLTHVRRAGALLHAWMWLDNKSAIYGWIPIIGGLLAWHYIVWRREKLKKIHHKFKRWVTKKLLMFVVAAAATPLIPWWVPANQAPNQMLSMIGRYPGLPATLAWAVVAFVLSLLCVNRQIRDSLLGHGKVLSLVSLGALLAVFTVTLIGWSLTY